MDKQTWWGKLDIIDLDISSYLTIQNKKREKNQKTRKRRNQIRKENWKPTLRWSKWRKSKFRSPEFWRFDKAKIFEFNYLNKIKNNIAEQISSLLKNWNIKTMFQKEYDIVLKERGWSYIWLCPYHREKNPSFSISKTKEVCKCYGCWKWWWALIYELFTLEYWEGTKRTQKRYELLSEKLKKYQA